MPKSLKRPPASAEASARPDDYPAGAPVVRAARAQVFVAHGRLFRPIDLERRARFARIQADAPRGG